MISHQDYSNSCYFPYPVVHPSNLVSIHWPEDTNWCLKPCNSFQFFLGLKTDILRMTYKILCDLATAYLSPTLILSMIVNTGQLILFVELN